VGLDETLADEKDGKLSLRLNKNENPYGCSPDVTKTLQDIAAAGPQAYIARYADDNCTLLVQALKEHHGIAEGDKVEVVMGPGLSPMMAELSTMLLKKGWNSVVPEHAYQPWKVDTAQSGANIRAVKSPTLQVDPNQLLKNIGRDTSVVYWDIPGNPTGAMATPAEVDKFLDTVAKRFPHVTVILDAAYMDYAPQDKQLDLAGIVKKHDNAVVLKTFSKAHGLPGQRLGYAICSDKLAKTWRGYQQIYQIDGITQALGLAAVKDTAFVDQCVRDNETCRTQFCAELDKLGIRYEPSHTNFVLLHVGGGAAESAGVEQRALQSEDRIRFRNVGLPGTIRVTLPHLQDLPKVVKFFQDEVAAGNIKPEESAKVAAKYGSPAPATGGRA
jgi:histidinol-phosphate aminotransferase